MGQGERSEGSPVAVAAALLLVLLDADAVLAGQSLVAATAGAGVLPFWTIADACPVVAMLLRATAVGSARGLLRLALAALALLANLVHGATRRAAGRLALVARGAGLRPDADLILGAARRAALDAVVRAIVEALQQGARAGADADAVLGAADPAAAIRLTRIAAGDAVRANAALLLLRAAGRVGSILAAGFAVGAAAVEAGDLGRVAADLGRPAAAAPLAPLAPTGRDASSAIADVAVAAARAAAAGLAVAAAGAAAGCHAVARPTHASPDLEARIVAGRLVSPATESIVL
jgi:hypothetical protein